jgi:hypothetical protein
MGMLPWGSLCAAQDSDFKGGYPTLKTPRCVQDEQDDQRALQAYRFFFPISYRLDGSHVPRDA